MSTMELDFNEETVFILGAGASVEYGLPLGEDLKKGFRIILNDHPDITESPNSKNNANFLLRLKENGFEYSFIKKIIEQIEGTGSKSVDDFLKEKEESSKESKLLKLLIYYSISQYCIQSNFLKNDWIEPLITFLMENHKDSFLKGKVKFVSFNYDQLLRAKIECILRDKFDYQGYKYREVLHVYGSIMDYSFKPQSLIEESVLKEIFEESKYLSLFRKSLPRTACKVEKQLTSAKNIIILGYGFIKENNDILLGQDRPGHSFYNKNVYATAYGCSELRCKSIAKTFGLHAVVENMKCRDMIESLIGEPAL